MSSLVPAALGGVLVALVVYHLAFVAGRLRRLDDALATHDELLGGGASPATSRIDRLERSLEEQKAESRRTEARLAELERIGRLDVHRVGFVRYNAFDDVGSDLSFALALLNR
ncbi:MAG: DUF4446 family protein, partial [Candidatus Eremiobacteraeota bacterium]|nr:DUF4446 family protein [Candidatus Eremiobacteraeota bacterium]